MTGNRLPDWVKGQFQVHFIYTGVCESMFIILPDGTSLLLDCGDQDALGRGELSVPVLPSPERHSGDWIMRYVERVNPRGGEVDYMMLTHYHHDHGGWGEWYDRILEKDGNPYPLSGFSQAAETLHFSKAIDRAWPSYDDPIPLVEGERQWKVQQHMKMLYDWKTRSEGLKMERFQLGATDQIAMCHQASEYPDFHIHNITANGRILCKDGSIRDLYKERIEREGLKTLNENGMSLGMIFQYGDFRFYSCGDFSDNWNLPDGSKFYTEDALAREMAPVHVAKINHHGYKSMTRELVSSLQARVYVSCVWDQLHNLEETMQRIMDPGTYPGERTVCPGIFPKERQAQDQGKPWMDLINPSAFEGGHMVLTVEKGGKEYSMAYVGADNEDMIVRSVMRFNTDKKDR